MRTTEARIHDRVLGRAAAERMFPRRSPRPSGSASTRAGPRRRTAPTRSRRSRGGARRRRASSSAPSICQLSARTPTAMAMAALTLDHLSGGRFILGARRVGPAGRRGLVRRRLPQAARAHARVRRDRAPGARAGSAGRVPRRALPAPAIPRGTGFGKPLKSITHPLRADLPIYLAAEGPEERRAGGRDRRRLAADVLRAPGRRLLPRRAGRRLRAARTRATTPTAFEVACLVPMIIADDVEAAADLYRPVARAVHRRHGRARGQLPQRRVRAHGLRRRSQAHPGPLPRRQEGTRPRPRCRLELVEDVALVGPHEKIRDDLEMWRESAVTTMIVSGAPEQLRTIAELVLA